MESITVNGKFVICKECVDRQLTTKKKIQVKGIMLDRAEGPSNLCLSWFFKDFASASRQIIENSTTAPKGGAYDKHDFKVIFEDGYIYEGRFDVQHWSYKDAEFCIAQHIRNFLQWIIDTDQKDKEDAQEFLDTYDLDTGILEETYVDKLLRQLGEARADDDTVLVEPKPELERVYIDVVDVAKIVRKNLKTKFPGQKFKVRSDRYSGGSSIYVEWTDGASQKAVEEMLRQYEGKTFDGMIDLASFIEHEKDDKLYQYGSDYVSASRTITEDMMTRIATDLAEVLGVEMAGIYSMDKTQIISSDMGALRWCDIVHRMVFDKDLTDYHGVKESQEAIANTGCYYEVY